MARYNFYIAGNKVICVTTFAKKPVRGVAKCAPSDNFDLETGRKLAQLRCDVKVAQRRLDKAWAREKEAYEKTFWADKELEDSVAYFKNANKIYYNAINALEDFENSLKNT